MANTSQKKTSSKAGRNKTFCDRYRLRNQREQNKGRRLVRYIVKHPADLVALRALRRISKMVSGFGPKLKELEAVRAKFDPALDLASAPDAVIGGAKA